MKNARDVISTKGPIATVYRCGTCKAVLHIAPAGFRSYADYGKAIGIRAKHMCHVTSQATIGSITSNDKGSDQ